MENRERKPAWTDTSTQKVTINIEKQSKLRKLKQNEEEADIDGADFSKRLKK